MVGACASTRASRSSCTSNIELPGLPTDIGPPHDSAPPDYAWTDLTYLFYHHHVSWGYYLKKGPEPDCETAQMFCTYQDQDPRTPGIWNPLPSFDTVRQDHQLGNIRDTSAFFTAAAQEPSARGVLGRSPAESSASIRPRRSARDRRTSRA